MPAVGWQQRRSPRRPRRQYPCRQNCTHTTCALPLPAEAYAACGARMVRVQAGASAAEACVLQEEDADTELTPKQVVAKLDRYIVGQVAGLLFC